MSVITPPLGKAPVHYPEDDGEPMSDNTRQFRCITTIHGGLDGVFRHDRNVFVAGNLLWYPVEGDNTIRTAPDIFVAFGRPKGDRGSYLQWLEGNIAPQVVFEILSPGNRPGNLAVKFEFYRRHGVEEYYIYDPDTDPDDAKATPLKGWLRDKGKLREIPNMNGWISPRLQVRFELVDGDLHLYGPDGKPFVDYVELVEQNEKSRKELMKAKKEANKAQKEVEKLQKEAGEAQQRAERLAAQLKALGIEPGT